MNHPEIDVDSIIAKLHSTRDKLLEESADSTDSRATVMLDQTSVGRLSRMDAMQAQAMAKAEEQRRQIALRKIQSALARLESDEFGECIACGEWISLAMIAMGADRTQVHRLRRLRPRTDVITASRSIAG